MFAKAIGLAQGAQAAEKNTRKLKGGDTDMVCRLWDLSNPEREVGCKSVSTYT